MPHRKDFELIELVGDSLALTTPTSGDARDRRRRPRFRLSYPVRLLPSGNGSQIETQTEDISCEGFFCITESLLSPNEKLECELVIPAGDNGRSHDDAIILRCRAEVVRIEKRQRDNPFFGVACRLADYTIELDRSHSHLAFNDVAELA